MAAPRNAVLDIVEPRVRDYLAGLWPDEDALVARLEAYGIERGFPLIGRGSGRWIELLTKMIGGRRVFEFGSGYGFSAFYFARAVGDGGQVIGSDRDAHEIEAHRRLYGDHPLAARIDLRVGSALDVFAQTDGVFDAVLIDVDKASYVACLEAAVPRVRPGGLILADNALWGGRVAGDASVDDDATRGIRAFNQRLFSHPRLDAEILAVGDGLAVGRIR